MILLLTPPWGLVLAGLWTKTWLLLLLASSWLLPPSTLPWTLLDILGVFDLKRRSAEWSVYDIEVLWCHTLIILRNAASSRTHLFFFLFCFVLFLPLSCSTPSSRTPALPPQTDFFGPRLHLPGGGGANLNMSRLFSLCFLFYLPLT